MQILHRWPDSFTVETAKIHLKQRAKVWYLLRAAEIENCPQFQAAFKDAYVIKGNKTTK